MEDKNYIRILFCTIFIQPDGSEHKFFIITQIKRLSMMYNMHIKLAQNQTLELMMKGKHREIFLKKSEILLIEV